MGAQGTTMTARGTAGILRVQQGYSRGTVLYTCIEQWYSPIHLHAAVVQSYTPVYSSGIQLVEQCLTNKPF